MINYLFIVYEALLILVAVVLLNIYIKPLEHYQQYPNNKTEKDFEKAIVPPKFLSQPLTAYIEPTVWEKPVLMNSHLPQVQFTRNF